MKNDIDGLSIMYGELMQRLCHTYYALRVMLETSDDDTDLTCSMISIDMIEFIVEQAGCSIWIEKTGTGAIVTIGGQNGEIAYEFSD